jgi:hypothetical protein
MIYQFGTPIAIWMNVMINSSRIKAIIKNILKESNKNPRIGGML